MCPSFSNQIIDRASGLSQSLKPLTTTMSRSPSLSTSTAFAAVRAGEITDSVVYEFQSAFVLQPLDPVPGPWTGGNVVERVPIGVENIRIPIQIQVNNGDAAASEILVGGPVDQPGLERVPPSFSNR